MTPNSAVAIILARAGSKGLPRKNSLPVAGKPCAQWTIEAALAARSVGTVALSTDDPDLLALARTLGIRAVERPAALASDTASVDDAARHALAALSASDNPTLPVVILYANVPVRPPGLIGCAVGLLTDSNCDSVQSYSPVGKHHPWWTVRVDERSGSLSPWDGKPGDPLYHGVYRRQDLPPAYIPDGGLLAVTRRALERRIPGVPPGPHAFLGLDKRGLINPEGSVIDIDSQVDLLVADAILRSQGETSRADAQSSQR